MTAVADVSKGQTDMLYKGELQTLTKRSIRDQACPGETRCTIILASIITMLISSGKSNSNEINKVMLSNQQSQQ